MLFYDPVVLEKEYGKFVLVDGYETDLQKQRDAREGINRAMYETALFIEKHRIYLPSQVCVSLKAFLDIMWNNSINVSVYGALSSSNLRADAERQKVLRDAYDALQKEVPAARAKLESEFRNLLGDDSHEQSSSPTSAV